jgi:hypothetical protein
LSRQILENHIVEHGIRLQALELLVVIPKLLTCCFSRFASDRSIPSYLAFSL